MEGCGIRRNSIDLEVVISILMAMRTASRHSKSEFLEMLGCVRSGMPGMVGIRMRGLSPWLVLASSVNEDHDLGDPIVLFLASSFLRLRSCLLSRCVYDLRVTLFHLSPRPTHDPDDGSTPAAQPAYPR